MICSNIGSKLADLFFDTYSSVGPNRTDESSFEGYGITTILLRYLLTLKAILNELIFLILVVYIKGNPFWIKWKVLPLIKTLGVVCL